jgi:hypothetical protein
MQADVATSSMKDDVEKAIADMLADSLIPLGEKNGAYRFLTQADVDLMKELNQFEYRNADVRNEVNGTLRSIFSPLPSARRHRPSRCQHPRWAAGAAAACPQAD